MSDWPHTASSPLSISSLSIRYLSLHRLSLVDNGDGNTIEESKINTLSIHLSRLRALRIVKNK